MPKDGNPMDARIHLSLVTRQIAMVWSSLARAADRFQADSDRTAFFEDLIVAGLAMPAVAQALADIADGLGREDLAAQLGEAIELSLRLQATEEEVRGANLTGMVSGLHERCNLLARISAELQGR